MKKNRYKKISAKRERGAAKDIGGRPHPGSGCFWNKKGDASNDYFLIEDKYTNSDRYSVTLNVLEKVEKEAINQRKIPVLKIGFLGFKNDYAIIRTKDYNKDIKQDLEIGEISTNKKSILLLAKEVYSYYVQTDSDILFSIKFREYNKEYLLLTWDIFVDIRNDFIME